MGWHPRVPATVQDADGARWRVVRAWPGHAAGDYVLEVGADDGGTGGRRGGGGPGVPASVMPGVRAGHLRSGQLELLPPGRDRGLPALRQTVQRGEVLVHRAHKRAVVRTGDRYLKIFRPSQSDEAAARHTRMCALLGTQDFLTPALVFCLPGSLTFTGLPGRSLFDLGQDQQVSDAVFEQAWQDWSRGWIRQHSGAGEAAHRATVEALPPLPAAVALQNLQRMVDVWLIHAQDVPEAHAQCEFVRGAARAVAQKLLAGVPDPPTWAHGDLHDKHIFVQDSGSPPGLLDFDEAGRAEAAADLANLAVHLELRLGQERLTPERFRTARGLVIATATELRVSPARFEAYANATRLRLGCLYSFRPQWAALAEDFLAGDFLGGNSFPGLDNGLAWDGRARVARPSMVRIA